MDIGDKVKWESVHGPKTGVIESKWKGWYIVRMENGKCIIAAETSLHQQ